MARKTWCYHGDDIERRACEWCRFLWDELVRIEATLLERGVIKAPTSSHPAMWDDREFQRGWEHE